MGADEQSAKLGTADSTLPLPFDLPRSGWECDIFVYYLTWFVKR